MVFYISTNKVKKLTGTPDAMNDEVLRVGIYNAQLSVIIPLLGFELANYIDELIVLDRLQDDYKTLVEDYLQPIIAWQGLSNAVEPNNGNTIVSIDNQTDLLPEDTKISRDHYRWISQAYLQEAKHYLCRVKFPYYETRQENVEGYFQGIELGETYRRELPTLNLLDYTYQRDRRE